METAGIDLNSPEDVKMFLDSLREKNPNYLKLLNHRWRNCLVKILQSKFHLFRRNKWFKKSAGLNMNININENLSQKV